MSLVRGRDGGKRGLAFLFEQVLLMAGTMWTLLCLAPILDFVKRKKKKKKLVKTPSPWIPWLKIV